MIFCGILRRSHVLPKSDVWSPSRGLQQGVYGIPKGLFPGTIFIVAQGPVEVLDHPDRLQDCDKAHDATVAATRAHDRCIKPDECLSDEVLSESDNDEDKKWAAEVEKAKAGL